jgi:hypothetical protein
LKLEGGADGTDGVGADADLVACFAEDVFETAAGGEAVVYAKDVG